MKKNIILGSLALAFAFSSTFASIDRSQFLYVKVKQLASQSNFTCEAMTVPDGTCNGNGTTDCSVIVQLSPSGSAGTVAHSDAACTTRLKDTTPNNDVYDINQSWDPQVVF